MKDHADVWSQEMDMTEKMRSLFEKYERSPDQLIPILQEVQREYGYVSPESVKMISKYLKVTENQIYGVSSFYAQFRFTPPGRHSIKVCLGTACHVKGGATLLEMLERELDIRCGETTTDRRFDLDRVACLGCCALSPVVQIDKEISSRMTVTKLSELLKKYE
ncbi:MAG TPA: NADH-quinone oxidoreductase subunit NuoE [Syntrophorhabdaceae bacterium]|nr:NADH-quinone oxidoreductase subunit NuoE [Syntrophorhabdaceae bacterium]